LNRYHLALSLAALAISASPANADTGHDIQYGNVPDWILPPPAAADPKPSEAAFRFVYEDNEERITSAGVESYTGYRIKILKPEALTIGNIAVAWSPSAGTANVHYVRIIRDGAVIDVLKQVKFKTLERETGLEQSILDGNLTATLQVPGLQVGDELEFAGTIVRSEPAFGTHAAGMAQLPAQGYPGAFRYRLLWPSAKSLTLRLTKDLPTPARSDDGHFKALTLELHDPSIMQSVDGAPPRFNVRRLIEYSDFGSWSDLARQMWPLFEKASTLDAKSLLHEEAKKIAAASADPAERAQAALRLVEGQIRYVYVGLDGGNYIPAPADQTWQRRFGDCKAKTAVLLALLRELGIKAEPVLINSKGGDGTDERLPQPILFDHVLVRANIAGKDIWLDGTRLGDRYLDMLTPPDSEWGLPIRSAGAQLIPILPTTSLYPQELTVLDIDASGGFAKDAIWTAKQVFHGTQAQQIEIALATLSPADAERTVKAYWRQQRSDIEPRQVGWSYDERHAGLVLTLTGTGKLDWDGDGETGHSLKLPGAGFYAPDKLQRSSDQDQSAAWAVEYPKFKCWVTTVRLPTATPKFHWSLSEKPVDRRFAGAIYWRAAGFKENLVRSVMSRQAFTREVPAAEAKQINAQIGTFDNYMSSVDEEAAATPAPASALPFDGEPDWTANPSICSPTAQVQR
jgi:hypothetical protein